MAEDYDVAIIGYGPTGLVLASALATAGHRVIVIERWPGLYGLPRLTHIDGETARIIQAVADVETALADAIPLESYQYLNGAGDLLVELDWSGRSCGFAAHIGMYQPDIEDAIDARVRHHPRVEVNQGWQAVGFDQGGEGVMVTIRARSTERDGQDSAAAQERTVRARYLVGADGANSFVRTSLGIERSDLGVNDRWLNLDTERLRPLPSGLDRLMQFCDPDRGHMFMPIGTRRQRFELALLPEETVEDMERPEVAWGWLRKTHNLGPEDVRIIRQLVYAFEARVANRWRDGRVFLAGDAAHTMPPYMGQGACSGMRDGLTLAWKLDLVLRGKAGDALLETYEAERRPHTTTIVETAVMLGGIANTHDHEAAAARDEAFRTGNVPPPPPFPTIRGGVVARDIEGAVAPLAGTLAPQGLVEVGGTRGRFDDIVGRGFTVVAASGDPREVLDPGQREFLDGLGAVTATLSPGLPGSFTDVGGTYGNYLREHDLEVFITRPDFHLFGAGALAELPRLVDELRTNLGWAQAPATASEREVLA
jgi:3-(3-hydroxy-phenyl)propionate hydroxylase